MALGVRITFIFVFLQLTEIAWRAEAGDAAGTLGNNYCATACWGFLFSSRLFCYTA